MFEISAPLLTAVKNAGRPIYGAVFIATSLLLFLPANMTTDLGLTAMVAQNRVFIGGGFIASASLLAISVLTIVAVLITNRIDEWRLNRHWSKHLSEITEAEKQFLRPYIFEGANTRYAELSNGIAGGLQAKGLIIRTSNLSGSILQFPFNLQPYVRRLLSNNPLLLV